ncbi:MAG TPA: RidA family protein [Streptosporangiaceae bacterium]|jgi:reactive intermediate/imine deaminase
MSATERQEYKVEGLPEPVSHYTDAVRWGDVLYISGCVAMTADGDIPDPDDVTAQAELVHEHLGRALRAAGTDFGHVLKVTVFLTDINDRAPVNVVREKFFGAARPASTLVEVSALIRPELKIEIEAVAAIPA